MRPEQEKLVRLKLREKQARLPEFTLDFIYVSETSKSLSTCFEYAKDLTLFYDYLVAERIVKVEQTQDITTKHLNGLSERNIVDFLNYLTHYTKTYKTAAGKEVDQVFTNQSEGKNRKLATLRVFFDYLFTRSLITRDVTKRVEMKMKKRVRIKNRLTDDEVQRFFRTIKEDMNVQSDHAGNYHLKTKYRDYVIAVLFAYCGLRVSEVSTLDIQDVFTEEHALVVLRKGGNEQIIPIPDAIYDVIIGYLDQRKAMTHALREHEDALFLSMQGKRIHPRSIRNMLEKYRQRAGLSMKITPHVFRRTFGTNHYNTFKDMYLTALILGHSSAETTRKYYADPNEERVRSSMAGFSYDSK